MKCLRCHQDNPPQAKFCLECGTPADGVPSSHADLKAEIAGLRSSLSEALEQQTATSDILRVISSSPTDVQPVFDAIVVSAARLCSGVFGAVFRLDGELIDLAGSYNIPAEFVERFRRMFPARPHRGLLAMRAVLDGVVVQSSDLATDAEFRNQEITQPLGMRSMVGVPMLRDGAAIGAITVGRRVAGPFPPSQIELLKTFADQAVIAIENVRLFQELQVRNRDLAEALEQQTATSEILRVISASPTDVQPVFDVIAASAVRLCHGLFCAVWRLEGGLIHLVAHHNFTPEGLAAFQAAYPRPPSRDTYVTRAILESTVVHTADTQSDPDIPPAVHEMSRALGFRSALVTPMLREGQPIGAIGISRSDVNGGPRPFHDKEIALLRTFADQAVIAIENVRLFNETKEALEQQTATGEILRVIASSPTELGPVMEAVAENAARVCGAPDSSIYRLEGEHLRLVARRGSLRRTGTIGELTSVRRDTVGGRVVTDRRTIHVEDLMAAEAEFPGTVTRVRQERAASRTMLATPLLREGIVLGYIHISRAEVQSFSAKQIALLETLANQAVIAIENVRLFQELQARNRELTESLDHQRATGEILQVISQSPTDTQPVFNAIVESAVRLCDAESGALYRLEHRVVHLVTVIHIDEAAKAVLRAAYPRPIETMDPVSARTYLEGRTNHIADVETEPGLDEEARARIRTFGNRSGVSVPMLLNDQVMGAIVVGRAGPDRTTRPFSSREIDLLETFAAQAVIAIENVRLFTELQARNAELAESLEQQTATAEILRVISSSPTDVQPVFDTIAERAWRLCGGLVSGVFQFDGELMHAVAGHNATPEARQGVERMHPMRPSRVQISSRAVLTRSVVLVDDMTTDPEYPRELALAGGWRSAVSVPMLREGQPIGAINVIRGEVKPFSDNEVELLKTFADQAVIAIENVRLFTELEARNTELTESLEQQTATGEILRVIARSPTNLQPVMDTVAENAARLCEAPNVIILRVDGDALRRVASVGPFAETIRPDQQFPMVRGSVAARAILDRRTLHIRDLASESDDEFPEGKDFQRRYGQRTMLAVPLLREGMPLGVIAVVRTEVRPFSDGQVSLLETFAAQAVIAIENVRLFTELQEKNRALTEAHAQVTETLEQQTATAEILRVIASSPTDLQPVMETVVEHAARVCGATDASIFRLEKNHLRLVARRGALVRWATIGDTVPVSRGAVGGRVVGDRRTIHVEDIMAAEAEFPDTRSRLRQVESNIRTILATPLLREGTPLGVIYISRGPEVHPFSAKQIALLETFANQAVIAIENVRLFKELEARTQDLTRSVGELQALGDVGRALSSTLDLDTILQTIVTRASQLAGTDACSVFEYDEVVEVFRLRASSYRDPGEAETLDAIGRATPIPKGQGVASRAAASRQPVQVSDITVEGSYESPIRGPLERAGYRAILTVPLFLEERVIGALGVSRKTPGEFAPEIVRLLTTFATQSALAIQNARLFREIADKSRLLEAASRHKSEFLANMSHELRTPLNAILGFSEVLAERMFGEVNEKQAEYLQDILSSGRHLLSLINDILDLSKVEAGRLELELGRFHLPTALDNALTLVRERATRHGITLTQTVDPGVGDIVADERKVKQILLNLLSNAVKFTPEGGRVGLTATAAEGVITIAVSDTGIGIAPEDQAAIFEEFRQVGRDDARKQEGTGLGLTLAKKFVELHGGRIWVWSQLGQGSTFTFSLPVRLEETGASDQGGGEPQRP